MNGKAMDCTRVLRKARQSGNTNCLMGGACRCHGGVIGDTKDPDGPLLLVSAPAFQAFVTASALGVFAR